VNRARIGLDPKTSTPRQVLFTAGGPDASALPLFLELDGVRLRDGFRIPHTVKLYPAEVREDGTPGFGDKPAQELYLTGGTLRAELGVEEFERPSPRPR